MMRKRCRNSSVQRATLRAASSSGPKNHPVTQELCHIMPHCSSILCQSSAAVEIIAHKRFVSLTLLMCTLNWRGKKIGKWTAVSCQQMNLSLCLAPLGAVAQSSERSAKNKARKPVKKKQKNNNKLFTYYLNILRCNLALSLPDRWYRAETERCSESPRDSCGTESHTYVKLTK